jgi:polysaccharide export outer membrane protein
VRFVSNKVTVLGEVARAGQHSFYDEKVTVFQALGLPAVPRITVICQCYAGKEKDNVIKYYSLDLTRKNIATSEYFYLLPNDVLIINPIAAKYRDMKDYPLNIIAVTLTSISALLSIILIVNTM